jgi:ATP-binding cassette subfamily B protein
MTTTEFSVAAAHRYDRRSAWRWVMAHLWRYPWLPIIFLVTTTAMAVAQSFAALAIGRTFDTVASGAGPQAIGIAALWVAGAYLMYGGSDIVNSQALRILGQRIERDVRDELYLSLLGKSSAFHGRQRVGDLMARATNDVAQIGLMIAPNAGLIVESALILIVPLITITLLRAELLLVPVLFLASFAIAVRAYSAELKPVAEAQRATFGTLNARLNEAVGGIEVVQGLAQERGEEAIFTRNARGFRDLFVREGEISARYIPLLLFGIATGLAFGHALLLFSRGLLSLGEIITYMTLIETLRTPTYFSLTTFAQVQLGLASAERIIAVMEDEPERLADASAISRPIAGAISFENVSFGYGDNATTLRNISFAAQPGETIAIVGQTGAGKTTLTRLVNRTALASTGHVLIDGVDVRDWDLDSLRAQIATIEQDIFLFSRSIADNIAFGARGNATQAQIEQAARLAQAHDFISAMPQGYATVIGERGVTLSGGQRQRIAIARAFLSDPRILILDDSTSAIDSATEDQIQRAMHQVLEGRTTLLITHRLSQIRTADRVIVLKNGELIAQGTHEELLANSAAYRRIFVR